jgi:hypothetical protein
VLVLAGLGLLTLFLEGDLALVGVCHMGTPMLVDMERPLLTRDMATPTMAGAILRPMDTHMDIHHAKILSRGWDGDGGGPIGILGGTNTKKV